MMSYSNLPASSPILKRAALEALAARRMESERLRDTTPLADLEQEPLILHDGELVPIHEGQREAWVSPRRFVAIFSGWRSGKTEIGPPWLLREMQRKGPGDYAVIAPTYPILDNKARQSLKRFINRVVGLGAYHSSGDIWTLTEFGCRRIFGYVPEIETRILFRHGSNADAIEAFDAKGIWADEPGQMEDELHTAMEARVSIGRHRILYTSRPFKWNWYVTKIWKRVMDAANRRRADAPEDIEVINFSSRANPGFSAEEFEEQRDKLDDWVFEMRYLGIPTKPAGVIYGCFDRRDCLVRVPISDDWQRAAGHDFGPVHMAGLWAYRHPDLKSTDGKPSWIVYSSYLGGNLTIKEHVQRFLYGGNADEPNPEKREPERWRCAKRGEPGDYKPVAPWAWGGNKTNEQGWREAFTMQGYPIDEPHEGAVDKGIEIVFGMIKTQEIRFLADLENVLSDIENYSYEVDEEGVIKLDAQGKPVISEKAKWHRMDALRGLCIGLTMGAGDPRLLNRSEEDDERTDHSERRHEHRGLEAEIREAHDARGKEPPRVDRRADSGRGRALVPSQRPSRR